MAVATRARIQVDIKPFHPYLLRLYGVSEAEFESGRRGSQGGIPRRGDDCALAGDRSA